MLLKTAVHVLQLRYFWGHGRLASCGGDRSVFSWDVATGRIIRKFRGHDGVANSVSLACPASQLPLTSASTLLSSCTGCALLPATIVCRLCTHACAVLQIAYAASDEVLVTGGYDQAIRLWDCRSRSFEPIQTMKNFGDAVTSVAVADRYFAPPLSVNQAVVLSICPYITQVQYQCLDLTRPVF